MKHILKTEADWLAIRKDYITASEAAVLVGADPYSSPKSIKEPSTFTGNAFTLVGQLLEPVVANLTNIVLGTRFVLYEQESNVKEFYTNGHFGATPDAHQDRKVLLECKTTRPKTFIKYGSVLPSKYMIQNIIQQMCVEDLAVNYGYISVMSTDLTQHTSEVNWPISVFKIWKDKTLCDILQEEAERFKTKPTFRVNSKVKQKVKLLLAMGCERII
jgi:predicted phage-related endonuclease